MKPHSGPVIASLVALAIAVLGLLLLAAAGPAYRLGLPLQNAFTVLRWGAYAGGTGAAVAVVAMLVARRRQQRRATWLAALALIAGFIAIGIPYSWQRRASSVPPIHDITT